MFHHPFRTKSVLVYFLDSIYCSSVTTVFTQGSISLHFDGPFDDNNLVLHMIFKNFCVKHKILTLFSQNWARLL